MAVDSLDVKQFVPNEEPPDSGADLDRQTKQPRALLIGLISR